MSQITSQVSFATIGQYRLLERVALGTTGVVYKGEEPGTGRLVAVKVLSESLTADPVLRMRFAQECQVAQRLNHPNLVRVLDYGLDGNKPYMVMEYVPGETLGQRLERVGRLAEAEAVDVIAQTGRGLHWAHQRKLIHRDVKPDNILLAPDGAARLTDLGLVKNLDGELELTRPMSGLGTPNFMAPEQFEDARNADALCDLYSLGATLYMAVTGELPFRARSARAVATIFKKKMETDLKPPRQLVPELSPHVEAAILRALHPNRKERHGSVQEFVDTLMARPAPAAVVASAPEASGRENRRRVRFASQRSTACLPLQREKPWEAQVVNISETGLCLQINRRFERGALLTLVLEGENTRRRSLVARVMWVKHQGAKLWKMGCQFDQPLCEFEVAELR
jgi:serine/threonine protein kinase